MMPIIMGKKMLIDEVVSSMITTSEYVRRQYELSIAPAPTKTNVHAVCEPLGR